MADLTELAERLRPETLPRLALFLSGALQRDLAVVHGSAARAAWEYAEEAELDELGALAGDWQVLAAAARALPLAQVNALLRERFGSAWQAASRAEIEAVGETLGRALAE
jgi:hypothetical protein